LFLLSFSQALDWQHNSSSHAVAVGILATKQTLPFLFSDKSHCFEASRFSITKMPNYETKQIG